MESWDFEGVPSASLESLWPGSWVPKSGHKTTKKENLYIDK